MLEFFKTHIVPLLALFACYLAAGVLNYLAAHKSQINAWCEARPQVAGVLKLLRAFGFDPWQARQALYLFFTSKLPPELRSGDGGSSGGAAPPPIGRDGQGPTHVDGQILQFRRRQRSDTGLLVVASALLLASAVAGVCAIACDRTFRWPDYAKCAPAPIEVLADQLLRDLSATSSADRVAAAPANAAALSRAREFLALAKTRVSR